MSPMNTDGKILKTNKEPTKKKPKKQLKKPSKVNSTEH